MNDTRPRKGILLMAIIIVQHCMVSVHEYLGLEDAYGSQS